MQEKYADVLDIATELAAQMAKPGLEKARLATAPEHHPDFDGEHCIDCDGDIPIERLAWGRIRCVHCQSALEAKRRLIRTTSEDWQVPGVAPI